jgi:hypothetical protein
MDEGIDVFGPPPVPNLDDFRRKWNGPRQREPGKRVDD